MVMTVGPGTKLGAYEVVAAIGAGGMGEVYRARDSRLNRDVALKIIRQPLADAEHLARFRREAQALAALNHPHVASIYELDEIGGTLFLVMELIPGQTLGDLLASRATRALDVTEPSRSRAKSPRPSKQPTTRTSSTAISNRPTSG